MRPRQKTGSVTLVALSCVTVLAMAVASFLSVSNLTMKLGHRSYAKDVSYQLAEMGLEQALRAFNDNATAAAVANAFSSWTLAGITATKSLSIASSRYGNSGITTAINIRVDHYLSTRKTTPWNVLTTYAVNDFVWYQGVWYLCKAAPPSKETPANTAYWTSAPESWNPAANYRVGNMVLFGGTTYTCKVANVSQAPPNSTYWNVPAAVLPKSELTAYVVDNVIFSGGMPYRCISAHSNQLPPNPTYWLSAPVIYAEGVAVLPDRHATTLKTQLRATLAPATLFPNAAGATTYTNLASGGVVDSYNSVTGAYNVGGNIGSSAVLAGENPAGLAVSILTARVNGYVAAPSTSSSPFPPNWNYATATAIVTSTPAPTIPSTRIDLTRVSRSPYVPQFDIRPVTAPNSLSNPAGTVTLPRAGDIVSADGKYYYATSATLDINSGDILNIDGPVVIDVQPSTAQWWIQGSGKIVIGAPTVPIKPTASLEIHVSNLLDIGSDTTGGIQNLTLDPTRCVILSTNTTNVSAKNWFWPIIPFYGVVYMPNAFLHVWNTGYNLPIYGALSAKNIYFESVAALHYDTALRTAVISGVDTPYRLTEWRELTDPSERVALP